MHLMRCDTVFWGRWRLRPFRLQPTRGRRAAVNARPRRTSPFAFSAALEPSALPSPSAICQIVLASPWDALLPGEDCETTRERYVRLAP